MLSAGKISSGIKWCQPVWFLCLCTLRCKACMGLLCSEFFSRQKVHQLTTKERKNSPRGSIPPDPLYAVLDEHAQQAASPWQSEGRTRWCHLTDGTGSTRTQQTNSYPDQFVPRPSRTQTNSYPADHLVPSTGWYTLYKPSSKTVAFVSGGDSDDTLERNFCIYVHM